MTFNHVVSSEVFGKKKDKNELFKSLHEQGQNNTP